MKICFLPIDNRPVCYTLPREICNIDGNIELLMPDRKLLGDLTKPANIDELTIWLKNIKQTDALILSLDTLVYGGLIPSRRSSETLDELKIRLNNIKQILKSKRTKIYAFSSIMRISNNNYNEEEKEYWSKYGKKIFDYSFNTHKREPFEIDIPQEIIEDYLNTRKRNFEVNKIYLEWQKEGLLDTLIFSKDDCAEYGFNVMEAQELEKLGGKTKTGADEIPLTLLSRAFKKKLRVFVEYTEPEHKDKISNYEDVPIEKSVFGQLELGGFEIAENKKDADLVLLINNFIERQGELVMGWNTTPYSKELVLPNKPFAIADVRWANGADNAFIEQLLPQINLTKFYGYSGWNTSANTLGTILATIKLKWQAKKYNEKAFKKLQVIRFLDDWAYQANVRGQITALYDIKDLMQPYEKQLATVFGYDINSYYIYPWNRKFEVEVSLC